MTPHLIYFLNLNSSSCNFLVCVSPFIPGNETHFLFPPSGSKNQLDDIRILPSRDTIVVILGPFFFFNMAQRRNFGMVLNPT